MTSLELLRTHVRGLEAEHCMGEKRVRAMILAELLPSVGEPLRERHKQASESLSDYAGRVVSDIGAISSREQCASLRGKLVAMHLVSTIDMPVETVRDVAHLLEDEGELASYQNVAKLVGGSQRSILAAFAKIRSGLAVQQRLQAKIALDVDDHHLDALVRCGFVEELRRGSDFYQQPINFATLRDGVLTRFRTWTPEHVDLQVVKDIAIIRSGLRIDTTEDHSEGIEERVTDYLIGMDVEPTVIDLVALLGGDSEQHRVYLTSRARSRGDVPLPRRDLKGRWTLQDMRMALPTSVQRLYDTALDPVRGSTRDKIGSADFGRIVLNPHAQLQIIGAVVTLHGARVKAHKFKATRGAISCANLAKPLAGIDVTNPAQLAAGFAANRMLLRGLTDRHDVQRANRDIWGWRYVIHIFDDYLNKADLPAALHAFLLTVRPAYPSGGQDLFFAVHKEMEDFNEDSKDERDKELQPYLKDIPAFLRKVTDAHDELEAFRGHVRAKVSQAETDAGVDLLLEAIHGEFEAEVAGSDGVVVTHVYHYTVHPWRKLMARTTWRRKKWPGRPAPVDPFAQHPGDERLFENRYAVELRDCTLDGRSVEFPLAIVRLHRDRAFWQPRDCPDQQAMDLRCARLKDFGLTTVTINQVSSGIANFEARKFKCARRVRNELGIFLFPTEEAYHASLIGALHVASRSVAALRVGDLAQWNVGQGLETGYDSEGQPFSILSSIPKRKQKPRKTPLTKRCDDLADKLLTLTRERFFQGGPIPDLPRADFNGKGLEYSPLMFCSRKRGLRNKAINTCCRLNMVGNTGFKTHYMKYIWSKLSRDAGSTLEERREEHGHTTPQMAEDYDVRTPDEEAKFIALRRSQMELRSQYHLGERDSPLPDQSLDKLRFERKRLINDIVFLEEEGAGAELDRANAQLSILDVKIARAEAGL